MLDAHADSYQEERVPTWEAAVLARERARRAGVPCVLVSACPPVDMLAGGHLVTLSRESERAGWAPLELLDARDEDPRTGGYPERLSAVIRAAVAAQPGRPVVAVLNRKGRARLLACGRCRAVLRCETCGAALIQLERPAAGEPALLSCQRCASSSPALCAACGPTRPRALRPGAARARDDLAALTGLEVTEVAGTEAQGPEQAAVLVGTEAVLHRASGASLVVFLDFDHELVAPRYRAGRAGARPLGPRLATGRGAPARRSRVVVRTRLCDHEASRQRCTRTPDGSPTVERQRRVLLRLPPTTALALVSGEGAAELVVAPRHGQVPPRGGEPLAGPFPRAGTGSRPARRGTRGGGPPRRRHGSRSPRARSEPRAAGLAQEATCYRDPCRPRPVRHGDRAIAASCYPFSFTAGSAWPAGTARKHATHACPTRRPRSPSTAFTRPTPARQRCRWRYSPDASTISPTI